MTPEAQRIAILTAQGWTGFTRSGRRGEDGPTGALRGTDSQGRENRIAPNPVRSLDAMHEAELATFTEGCIWSRYYMHLVEVCNAQIDDEKRNSPMSATAAQRAEAFLRTLNLWTE